MRILQEQKIYRGFHMELERESDNRSVPYTFLNSSPEVQLPFTVATLTGKGSVLGRKENRERPATDFYVYGQDYLNEYKSN